MSAMPDNIEHECGQCPMLSIFSRGNSMISIASSPLFKKYKQFSIMQLLAKTMCASGSQFIRGQN